MRIPPLLLLLPLALAAVSASADDDLLLDQAEGLTPLFGARREASHAPNLDPKRIINQSSSFLKDREPDMTAEESAIYDKMAGMLSTSPELAIRLLEGMVGKKEPPSPAFDLILGNAYYAANQFDRAESMYQAALKRYPDFLRAWTDLGILDYAAGRYPEAVANLTKAVSLGDRDAATFGVLGYSLEKQGDLVSAEMDYLQALGSDPANLDWKEGLLRVYIAGRQFGRAEPLARTIVEAEPAEAQHWLDYAGILLAEGRKPDALVILDEAVGAGAAGPDELELLGDLYAEQGLAPEAAAAYRKLLASARPRGERKLLQFARVLIAAGQLEEAEHILGEIAGASAPASQLELLRVRADLRLAQERWPEARREIEALLAKAPLDGRGLLVLGQTYAKEGNWPRAAIAFEAANRIPASAYQADLELANIEIQNRHFTKAAAYLEKALALHKTDAVETAYARIKALLPNEPNPE